MQVFGYLESAYFETCFLMCGIALLLSPAAVEFEMCATMTSAIVHRGPDGGGECDFRGGSAKLNFGHRRLAILDLTESGKQPMVDPETGNVLIYNGEVYNFRALRRELEGAGIRFLGSSDSEVILYGFRHWGIDVFRRLHGMFALAIYVNETQRLVIARDGLGIKPLYWGRNEKALFACSELQAILKSGMVEKRLDAAALAGLLAYGSVPEPLTLIEGVTMFPPGHYVDVRLANASTPITPKRFWQEPEQTATMPRAQVVERLHELLEDAARTHLESDAPLGLFLSGGLDSTALTLLAAKISQQPLTTLTVAFPGMGDLDESNVAAETAKIVGSRHVPISMSNAEVNECVSQWVERTDQPSLDGLNTFIVSKAARDAGLKVVWSGLGGDELFAGYSSFRTLPHFYRWTRALAVLPRDVRQFLGKHLIPIGSEQRRAKAAEMLGDVGDFVGLVLRRRRLFGDAELENSGLTLESGRLNTHFLPCEFSLPKLAESRDLVAAMSAIELSVYMRNTLLRDSDVCGMAHSIEIRVPMLHTPLVEFALSIPGRLRIGASSINKPLLAAAVGNSRAIEVASQPKRGFSLPYAKWLRGPFNEQLAEGIEVLKINGTFESEWVQKYWLNALADKESPWNRAWLLGVIGLWMKKHGL